MGLGLGLGCVHLVAPKEKREFLPYIGNLTSWGELKMILNGCQVQEARMQNACVDPSG